MILRDSAHKEVKQMKKNNDNTTSEISPVFVLQYLDDAELDSNDITGCGGVTMDIINGNGWP